MRVWHTFLSCLYRKQTPTSWKLLIIDANQSKSCVQAAHMPCGPLLPTLPLKLFSPIWQLEDGLRMLVHLLPRLLAS